MHDRALVCVWLLNAAASTGVVSAASPPSLLREWFRKERPLLTVRRKPPPCATFTQTCSCTKESAAPFMVEASAAEARLTAAEAKSLRIFFLDGHVGPMNDMMSTMHDVLGVPATNIEQMVFMQGMLVRNNIDKRFTSCRLCHLLRDADGVVQPWRANMTKRLNQWLTQSTTGRTFTLPNCEKARCREAVYNEATRREFALLFGSFLESSYDVVACNFPTWQVSGKR